MMPIVWNKSGRIFDPDPPTGWRASHACVPAAWVMSDRIRVFFSPRDREGRSVITYLDVDRRDPTRVLYVHDQPLLPLGEPGTFDDSGIMPGCVLEHDGVVSLYYVGWNRSVSVPYRNAIGLAVSEDGGRTFRKRFTGPLLDRGPTDPHFVVSPCVLRDETGFHLWYASGTSWMPVAGKLEPLYHIKHARSDDGIHWDRRGTSAIPPLRPDEANARPTVVKDGDLYRMWFCFRGSADFRDGADSYRIGYAESRDGAAWQRRDEDAGIAPSASGWDDRMLAYPTVVACDGRLHLFYNGNGFGQTGIGHAWATPGEGR